MKVEIPEEIMRRFIICVEYATHNFLCNKEGVRSTEFLKIPNCPFLDICGTTDPLAKVVKIFKKVLSRTQLRCRRRSSTSFEDWYK